MPDRNPAVTPGSPARHLARPPARPPAPPLAPPLAELLAEFGVDSRRVREITCRLADGGPGWTIPELVAATATSRRTVEAVLRALGDEVQAGAEGRLRLADGPAAGLRHALGCTAPSETGMARPGLADPVGHLVADHADTLAVLRRLVDAAPRSRRSLDHVAATAETALRRALYLGTRFWLDGARLVCLGDHDLTSLAAALLHPGAAVTVVDIDDRICEFIDREAAALGLGVRCRWADLRLGLPASVAGSADLIFTDPPYTPEGVEAFLYRGLQALRDRTNGRLLMAYGHGETMPGLGAKVQAAAMELQLDFEAILPGFNAYHGAEAIGGVSDLYVCRPTARSWQVLARRAGKARRNIYSQGAQAVGSGDGTLDQEAVAAILRQHGPDLLVGEWAPAAAVPGAARLRRIGLGEWLAALAKVAPDTALPAVDLTAGYSSALTTVLLAAHTDHVVAIVDNNAEDLASAAGQRELSALLAPSYRLRYLRSTPSPKLALVVGERAEPAGDPQTVLRWIQDRPHGKVANGWREGLITLSRSRGDPPLTKNAARALIAEADPGLAADDAHLLELPRHRLHDLATAVAASVQRLPRQPA